MSSLTKLTLAALLATLVGSGCCLTSPCLTTSCGAVGGACGDCCNIPTQPACGAASCDAPCGPAACRPGGCLGLGCIGKLFNIASYGCTGCASGGCGGGYYHDWISDPPCADPCDGCGQYTGIASGGVCGSCTGVGVAASCGAPEASCAAPACGVPTAEPTCGVPGCTDCVAAPMMMAEPTCGLADGGCDGACGGSCVVGSGGGGGLLGRYGNRSGFKVPGRAIYSTLGGVGGFFRELGRGLLPARGSCNAFSGGACGSCDECVVVEPGCGIAEPSCGCVGATTCQDCELVTVPVQVQATQVARVQRPPTQQVVTRQVRRVTQPATQVVRRVVTQQVGSGALAQPRIPHEIVTKTIRTAHNRPPHKVLSKHLR